MSRPMQALKTDVVVVGSGPGGSTVARELTNRGKAVVVCEAGGYHRRFGFTAFLLAMMDKLGFTFSKEGTWVVRPKTAGGATVVYCGTAVRPPAWIKERYGIDLDEEVDAIYKEIPIRPLADHLVGPAARALMESARGLGLDWNLLDKWIRHDRCKPNCGKCSVGCPEGAKWTAREYLDEAERNGARVLLRTKVDRVITEGGKATGVRAKGPGGWVDIQADTVVLSAGGQGTPPILQRSGVYDAGRGFFADPLWFVAGPWHSRGSLYEVPMTAGVNLSEDGIVMTDLMPPPMMYGALVVYGGPRTWGGLPKVLRSRKTLSIMIKVRDGLDGRVNLDESFSKPIDYDTWWKLNKGAALAEEILLKAGVRRDDLVRTGILAAHPGGTVRIGHLLDKDCQTPIRNCYCMDTSIIPEPWGLPPTVTVVAMARRLARRLTASQPVEGAVPESG